MLAVGCSVHHALIWSGSVVASWQPLPPAALGMSGTFSRGRSGNTGQPRAA